MKRLHGCILAILTKSKSDVIIAGDFNIDMLKINENNHVSNFFNTVTSHTFFPKITLPTRFSDRNCTLIDNFLCKLSPTMINSKAGILMNNLSDHLPCVINIPNLCNYQNGPKCIHLKTNDINSVTNFKMDIMNANIYDKLNHDEMGDPNDNYNIVETIIQDKINTHFPTRTVKFNYNKHKKTKWVTNGIIKSIKFRNCMYKKLKATNPDSDEFEALKINLRTKQNTETKYQNSQICLLSGIL